MLLMVMLFLLSSINFCYKFIEPSLNFIFLIFIPKSKEANSIDKFFPIVLGIFLFKVITKIISDRLALIASRIVSLNQFGFIRGRQI